MHCGHLCDRIIGIIIHGLHHVRSRGGVLIKSIQHHKIIIGNYAHGPTNCTLQPQMCAARHISSIDPRPVTVYQNFVTCLCKVEESVVLVRVVAYREESATIL